MSKLQRLSYVAINQIAQREFLAYLGSQDKIKAAMLKNYLENLDHTTDIFSIKTGTSSSTTPPSPHKATSPSPSKTAPPSQKTATKPHCTYPKPECTQQHLNCTHISPTAKKRQNVSTTPTKHPQEVHSFLRE